MSRVTGEGNGGTFRTPFRRTEGSRPPHFRGEQSSAADGAVGLFAEDVGVTCVAGGLLDHVDQDPPQ